MIKGDIALRLSRYVWILEKVYSGAYCIRDIEEGCPGYTLKDGTRNKIIYKYLKELEQYGIIVKREVQKDGRLKFTVKVDYQVAKTKYERAIRDFILDCGRRSLAAEEREMETQKRLRKDGTGELTGQYRAALKAMVKGKQFRFRYRGIRPGSTLRVYRVNPYAIKYFNKCWYLWGEDVTKEEDNVTFSNSSHISQFKFFALNTNRMPETLPCDDGFEIPASFDFDARFAPIYGVIDDRPPQDILLKVYTHANKDLYYLETPIHPSQEIYEEYLAGGDRKDERSYIIFKYHLAPTFDFLQKILSDRDDVEILAPEALRSEVRTILLDILAKYQE